MFLFRSEIHLVYQCLLKQTNLAEVAPILSITKLSRYIVSGFRKRVTCTYLKENIFYVQQYSISTKCVELTSRRQMICQKHVNVNKIFIFVLKFFKFDKKCHVTMILLWELVQTTWRREGRGSGGCS